MSAENGTFSILAKEENTLGAASASGSTAVGDRVLHAKPGVGAVVTQGYTNVSYGPKGLELMASGATPEKTLERLLSEDPGREFRQVAIMDIRGKLAVHTGARVPDSRGHVIRKNYAVIGNLLAGSEVVESMAEVFERSEMNLSQQMLEALKAGHRAGGDRRGERSAALVVVNSEKVRIRLDVRDHPSPIEELEKLLKKTTIAHRLNDRWL
jgi:uncharacterized Ntn-hydrolase superfamily protein